MHTYWPDYIHPSERSKIPSRNSQPTPLDRIQIDGNTKKLLSNDFIAKTLEQISRNWTFEPAIKIRFDLAKHLMNEQFTGEWDKVAGYKEYGLILLAKCINWLSQIDVLKFYSLIKAWPWESVPINAILQILDCSTPTDPVLRTYAVRKALSKRLNHEPLLNIHDCLMKFFEIWRFFVDFLSIFFENDSFWQFINKFFKPDVFIKNQFKWLDNISRTLMRFYRITVFSHYSSWSH